MAMSEDRQEDHPPARNPAVLWALLGLLAACFSVNDLLAAYALRDTRAWQPLGLLAINLLMVGAIWGLSRLKPSLPKAVGLSLLLGIVALAGFGVTATALKVMVANNTLSGPWTWQTTVILVSNLLIGMGAIVCWFWLKPWTGLKGLREPVSPATE